MTMKNTNINEVLKELKEYDEMMKALKAEVEKLQDECKEYMTENNLTEVFNEDKTIVARYTEVISNRFDTTAFKKVMPELAEKFTKTTESRRFSIA